MAEYRQSPGLITETDMYFPSKKIAVFCDYAKHHGGAGGAKDEAINARLHAVPVRVSGKMIVSDLEAATDLVIAAFGA